jgi:MFS family permease
MDGAMQDSNSPDATSALPQPPALYRWSVLVFVSVAMFGNYYVYDSIAPLADVLKDQLGFSDVNIGTLNAIYSVPNILMVLIGGIIIDRIGTRRSTVLFALICMIGALITVASGDFYVMATGRLVFGLGSESLIVAVTTALARWFRGKELSFAFGLNLTLARAGSFAADWSPTWFTSAFETWRAPLLIALVFAFVSFIGAAIYWILESQAIGRYQIGAAEETEKPAFGELFRFGRSYLYVVALCVTFYSAVFPFRTFAIKFFIEYHGTSRELGGQLNSMLVLAAMFFTPLFGLLVDYVGRRALFMMYGSLLMVPVYLMLIYAPLPLWVPMAILGIAFSLIPAVMWPSVAYIVEERRLGTAYGLMTMIQNVGLALFNWMVGAVNDAAGASPENPAGHIPGMWIFSILGFAGFFFAWKLRRAETGPDAHGLETITARSGGEPG